MLTNLNIMLSFFRANYNDILVNVVVMVSLIITIIGLAKPIIFNRIKNKELRKAALALTNVAACFLAAFIYFLRRDWNFDYYVLASVALSMASIFTYYLYETIPYVRSIIGGIGQNALSRILNVSLLAVATDDANAVKTELKNAKAETKLELTKVANKIKEDKDLKGL